ncbi:MarR family transcriptional regulator [Desulfosporosinus sp. PR]|uniref:MarR family winged helix-turn-helix transcriptional regulator n=1 Tax=Candidatus Desulfosporosinus nitrosoreducens TaxID=3401928 RepID=UPI0027F3A242|nr:MarR family transcriptional regulator [Desulfosporosinus sp. PR]MDQ7095050.1 MarR family transcriptional regulator [Desulfosporosinus sp. PR]
MNQEFSIRRYISTLYRYGNSHIAKRLEFLNIGSGYSILLTLYRQGGISQEELSAILKIDKGTTAKATKKLEDEGYLSREIDVNDRRAYNVFLTAKGLEVIPKIQSAIKEWEKIITSGFSEKEIYLAAEILYKMAENASKFKVEDEGKENEITGL